MAKLNLMNPTPPKDTRRFYDPVKLREWVQEDAKEAFTKKLNTLETPDFKLNVKDIHYGNQNKDMSFGEQKSALLEKRDLTIPLKGTFQLVNKNTGKVVDEKTT